MDVAPVLDLTEPLAASDVGVNARDITRDDDETIELCRTIADVARSHGFNAILSPSAAAPGERNLNVYLDARPSDLRLDSGGEREPLNYGPQGL